MLTVFLSAKGKVISMSELLLNGGLAVAGISLAIGLAVFVALWISRRKLNAKLETEYGKKQ